MDLPVRGGFAPKKNNFYSYRKINNMPVTILYIIPYRAVNQSRVRNLKMSLQWVLKIKQSFERSSVSFDILVIEQDQTRRICKWPPQIQTMFIHNKGIFNKGWAF